MIHSLFFQILHHFFDFFRAFLIEALFLRIQFFSVIEETHRHELLFVRDIVQHFLARSLSVDSRAARKVEPLRILPLRIAELL